MPQCFPWEPSGWSPKWSYHWCLFSWGLLCRSFYLLNNFFQVNLLERIKNDTVLKDVKTYLERTLDRFYQTRDIKVLGEKLFQITFQNYIDYNDNNNDDDDYNVVVVDDYNHNVDVNDDEHSNMVGLFLHVIYYITYYILYIMLYIFYILHYIQFRSFLWMSKTCFDLLTRHLQKKSKLYS